MLSLPHMRALKLAMAGRDTRRYPGSGDTRSRGANLFPSFSPKFPLRLESSRIFTIGSCFARNIEEVLNERGCDLPTMAFVDPQPRHDRRSNGLLNEYNPGAIGQRILATLEGRAFSDETVVPTGDLWTDLMRPGGDTVSREIALERRREISAVYDKLAGSHCVIITLGYIEAWYDEKAGVYLNRHPPKPLAFGDRGRFTFRRLGVEDCLNVMAPAFDALGACGVKIILTVSPVPLQTTFTGEDCVLANEFSKSVLRVTAQELARRKYVDYFPAYEIVRSGGLSSYDEDNVHVSEDLVREITGYMVGCYQP